MPITDWGEVQYDFAPLISTVRSLPADAWVFRSDRESDTTSAIRYADAAFPTELAEAAMAAAAEQLLVPGYTNRALLSRVPAGCRILPHTDDFGAAVRSASIHCHIPLITAPEAVMGFPADSLTLHMPAGRLYSIDETRPHYVENPSAVDRVHLLFAFFPHVGLDALEVAR